MAESVGSLRGELGLDASGFTSGLLSARRNLADFAQGLSAEFARLGEKVQKIGVGMTLGITAPFVALNIASARGAGAFEASMNKVQAALRGIGTQQLAELSQQARTLGPAVGRSAIEAAQGIETLALAGMNAESILNGGLASSLELAAANATDLSGAGSALTDVMAQFGLGAQALPGVVDKITGALDASKFSFGDFQAAISQAGGVAGSAGVSFEDFNTAIAATSSLFASGSDAGTSFKTFLTTLNPKSDEAAAVMEKLGIRFYDTAGRMKDLADVSQILKDSLGGLSERSRTEALTTMFGTDAMRTAIGLMKQGKQGFDELQASIAKGDAGAKLAIQMQGFEAATNRLRASFEGLKIAIGDTGILSAFTGIINAASGFVSGLANMNPALMKVALYLGAFVAALGPLTIALVAVVKIGIAVFLGRLGLMGITILALINPIGALGAALVFLATRFTVVGSAAALAARTIAGFLGPIGLIVTALAVLVSVSDDTTAALDRLEGGADLTQQKLDEARARAIEAGVAVGQMKDQTAAAHPFMVGISQALGMAANEANRYANSAKAAAVASARLRLVQLQEDLKPLERVQRSRNGPRGLGDRETYDVLFGPTDERLNATIANGQAQLKATKEELRLLLATPMDAFQTKDKTRGVDVNFAKPDKVKKVRETKDKVASGPSGASGPSKAERAATREMMALQQKLDVASAKGDVEEIERLQRLIDLKRRAKEYEGAGVEAKTKATKLEEKQLEEAGLKTTLANVQALRDSATLVAATAEAKARDIATDDDALQLQAAEIRGDQTQIKAMQEKMYLEERVNAHRRMGVDLIQAQANAAADLAQMDAARLDMKRRDATERGFERELELARLRGADDREIRRLERRSELAKRTRDIEVRDKTTPENAADRARIEMADEDRAKVAGDFRGIVKDGFRAALEGDLGGFFKGWIADRAAKGLEDALNNVANMLFKLFSDAFGQGANSLQGGASGGGFFGSIIQGLGGLLGGGSGSAGDLPGFATGGSFRVGGVGGIDKNVIAFRATKGEMVDIRKPGNDNGGGYSVHMPITLHAPGADPAQLARLQASFEQAQREMPSRVVAAVGDARARNVRIG